MSVSQILLQGDYENAPGKRNPKCNIVVPYDLISRSGALANRLMSFPGSDKLAFAQEAEIGDKMSICLGVSIRDS